MFRHRVLGLLVRTTFGVSGIVVSVGGCNAIVGTKDISWTDPSTAHPNTTGDDDDHTAADAQAGPGDDGSVVTATDGSSNESDSSVDTDGGIGITDAEAPSDD